MRAFELANVFHRFEKSSCGAIPFSFVNIARPINLCCDIFASEYFSKSLSFENERSPEATVTGNDSKIRNATETYTINVTNTVSYSAVNKGGFRGGAKGPWPPKMLKTSIINNKIWQHITSIYTKTRQQKLKIFSAFANSNTDAKTPQVPLPYISPAVRCILIYRSRACRTCRHTLLILYTAKSLHTRKPKVLGIEHTRI